MNPTEYIKQVLRSESPHFGNLNERILHGTLGISNESGELSGAVKKSLFYNRELDVPNVKEELGDMFWYAGIIIDEIDSSFEEIMDMNIAKLRARYPKQFDDNLAENRDLSLERRVLEGTTMKTPFKIGDKINAAHGGAYVPEGSVVKNISEDGTSMLLVAPNGSIIGYRPARDLKLVGGTDEIDNECAESHATLKALAVSAEKNRALYNFDKPDPKVLETFPTPEGQADLKIHIRIPEFTSLCPITGQPDWATIHIIYKPDKLCVESKSIKLYKEGFRNFGEFHEACCQRICSDLVNLLNPLSIKVVGEFAARGGIPIHPVASYEKSKEKESGGTKENKG